MLLSMEHALDQGTDSPSWTTSLESDAASLSWADLSRRRILAACADNLSAQGHVDGPTPNSLDTSLHIGISVLADPASNESVVWAARSALRLCLNLPRIRLRDRGRHHTGEHDDGDHRRSSSSAPPAASE